MQPYPYSNYSNSKYPNQYAYSNQLYQQPYLGQYGNTNLGKYPQNVNPNISQSVPKKSVKKVEIKEPSSSEEDDDDDDDEEEKKSDSDASASDKDEKQSKNDSDSEEKESESDDDEDGVSSSSNDKKDGVSDEISEKSKEEVDSPKSEENPIYPELEERVKVFQNIAQELDDLEDFLATKFQYFQPENSEAAISDRFTRK